MVINLERTQIRTRLRAGRRIVVATLTAAVSAVMLVVGCQGSSPSARGKPAGLVPSARPVFTPTVGPSVVRTVEAKGHSRFLADYRGRTLYTSTGPASAKTPLCTGSCTSVWHPVLVHSTGLSDPAGLGVRIGTLDRPGGLHQLAVNGHRAYTFVGDTKPGQLSGDGFITGGLQGRTHTWRAVRVSPGAPVRVVFKPE